ncbi:hypothetical protein M1105_07795 [Limibaculum sp. FT325]|uniref:hypothetical protein n=1 Tax=Thermohalobaculum sediminis TaxID=2939436 RepID=UPI0020BE99D6|nr:hypothetical protein [Limibaculum sediminis]MCL5776885.1 hypothetical protein [Limibaculum sediminis]
MKNGKVPRTRGRLITVRTTEIASQVVIVTVLVLFAVLNFAPASEPSKPPAGAHAVLGADNRFSAFSPSISTVNAPETRLSDAEASRSRVALNH